jgi:hypothetical protein
MVEKVKYSRFTTRYIVKFVSIYVGAGHKILRHDLKKKSAKE